jgi:hypothetical protein
VKGEVGKSNGTKTALNLLPNEKKFNVYKLIGFSDLKKSPFDL